MARSGAVAGAPARDQTAKERPHTEGDAEGLSLFVHSFLCFLFGLYIDRESPEFNRARGSLS
jgi:hypothetical protein